MAFSQIREDTKKLKLFSDGEIHLAVNVSLSPSACQCNELIQYKHI